LVGDARAGPPHATEAPIAAASWTNSRRLSVMSYPLFSLSACQRKWSAMNVEMK
jgi:hypothetical protein